MTRPTFLAAYPSEFVLTLIVGFMLAHLFAALGPRVAQWYHDWNAAMWHKLRVRRGLASDRPRKPSRQWRRQMQREHVKQLHDAAVREYGHATPRRARRDGMRGLLSTMRRAANPKTPAATPAADSPSTGEAS